MTAVASALGASLCPNFKCICDDTKHQSSIQTEGPGSVIIHSQAVSSQGGWVQGKKKISLEPSPPLPSSLPALVLSE